jgi:hypothetical protein
MKQFSHQDKVELLRLLKIKRLSPGQRFFAGIDQIDSFNLLMKGKIGIYYPEREKIV